MAGCWSAKGATEMGSNGPFVTTYGRDKSFGEDKMKQLLLATATLVGMSAAALAAEPVALTDSQLDKVTAGQTLNLLMLPIAFQEGSLAAGGILPAVTASAFAANLTVLAIAP
jgi:hypothetical protein